MSQERKHTIVIGIFYIIAFVASILAVILYQPINDPVTWYQVAENGQTSQVIWGVICDLLLLVSAMGTAVFLAPYLAKYSQQLSFFYYSCRLMEAVFIGIGILSILVLVSLSNGLHQADLPNHDFLLASGHAWQVVHRWIMVLGPNLMLGINTSLYSYLLLKIGLVPKPLAKFGLITAVLVFIAGLLDLFGIIEPWSILKGIISLPVGIYELSLAGYLIIKGFKMPLSEMSQ